MEKFEPRRDKMPSIEPLEERHVSVFGAQGHLGSALLSRLSALAGPATKIEGVAGERGPERDMLNIDAAHRSDLLILSVRPDQVAHTLRGIHDHLRIEAQVLSFAANTSAKRNLSTEMVARAAGRPAARGMTDTHFNLAAFTLGEHFSTRGYESIFEKLSRTPPLMLKDDAALDRFSVMLCQLFVATLMEQMGEIKSAEPHVAFLTAQKEFRYDHATLLPLDVGNAQTALEEIATPGGISERFVRALRERPHARPADLFLEVSRSLKR